jgi:hypothetical protein
VLNAIEKWFVDYDTKPVATGRKALAPKHGDKEQKIWMTAKIIHRLHKTGNGEVLVRAADIQSVK